MWANRKRERTVILALRKERGGIPDRAVTRTNRPVISLVLADRDRL